MTGSSKTALNAAKNAAGKRPPRPRSRPACARPFRLGLTGNIGTGKSTAARLLRCLAVPVFDSDAAVHQLYETAEIRAALAARWPEMMTEEGRVNRPLLSKRAFEDSEILRALEKILHPKVDVARTRFLRKHRRCALVVFDIPLLFEAGLTGQVDGIWLTDAPPSLQRLRVLRRAGMSLEKFNAILAQQWPAQWKRRAADRCIPSGLGRAAMLRALKRGLVALRVKTKHQPQKQGAER